MKINQLRNIIAIAERGSLRAAARHLEIAQPALTRSIHELEQDLGVPLFERRARGMVLTPMGEAFLRRANAVMTELRRARDEVEQLHGGTHGQVVAGLSLAAHVELLPRALKPFRARYPHVQLHLIEGWYPTLETGLKDGSIDFYIGPKHEHPPAPELIQEHLFDNTRIVLGRRGHPHANARALSELANAEWATTSVTFKAEEELRELFERNGLPPPRLALRSQSAVTLIVAISNTDLLTMVPVQWTKFIAASQSLVAIPLRDTFPAPDIVLVRRTGLLLTPAAEFLLDLLRRNVPTPEREEGAAYARRRLPGSGHGRTSTRKVNAPN